MHKKMDMNNTGHVHVAGFGSNTHTHLLSHLHNPLFNNTMASGMQYGGRSGSVDEIGSSLTTLASQVAELKLRQSKEAIQRKTQYT